MKHSDVLVLFDLQLTERQEQAIESGDATAMLSLLQCKG